MDSFREFGGLDNVQTVENEKHGQDQHGEDFDFGHGMDSLLPMALNV